MRAALALLLGVHGAIHLLGLAKGARLAEVAQLKQPISKAGGALWLAAAIGLLASAILLFFTPRWWWLAGAPAVLLSQLMIVRSWRDARFGTVANVILVVPLLVAGLDVRPSSLRSRYQRETEAALERRAPARMIEETDLARLPPLVQRYLRRVGVVGKPHVRGFRAEFRSVLRQGREGDWMDAWVEQYDFFDRPSRYFFMQASRAGVPVDGYHRYVGPHATMEIRIAGLIPVADARGARMDQSETVTLLNDLCLLAPGALVDAPIEWETLDERRARATYTNAGHSVRAELSFDEAGDLVDFVSNDRFQSADGVTYRLLPWSTPIESLGRYHGLRLMQRGEARWQEPDGDWAYIRFETLDIEMIQ